MNQNKLQDKYYKSLFESKMVLSVFFFLACSPMSAQVQLVEINSNEEMLSKQESSVNKETQEDNAKELLLQARQKLEAAETLAVQIIDAARLEAAKIQQEKNSNDVQFNLDDIKNKKIAVEARALSVQNLLKKIMPENWRVMVDFDETLLNKRIDFVSEKSRDEMIFDIAQSLDLSYQYFSELKDANGFASPLLVVTKNSQ